MGIVYQNKGNLPLANENFMQTLAACPMNPVMPKDQGAIFGKEEDHE